MNSLVIGANKEPILESIGSGSFLFIDDGPLIDALQLPKRIHHQETSVGVVHFDVSQHWLNPLHKLDYRRAREFVSVLNAVFPEGESTLTKKNSDFVLLTELLKERKKSKRTMKLDRLIKEPADKKDTARQDAYQKIQTLLLSPVLRAVLCKATNFPLDGIVLARLDRAVLGDFDAFVLANLLISQFQGQVIVPDFGFYGREHHISLIRQGRLIAGVNTLSELPVPLRQALLAIPTKMASKANYEDAEVLAQYAGLAPRSNAHNDFVQEAMS